MTVYHYGTEFDLATEGRIRARLGDTCEELANVRSGVYVIRRLSPPSGVHELGSLICFDRERNRYRWFEHQRGRWDGWRKGRPAYCFEPGEVLVSLGDCPDVFGPTYEWATPDEALR